MQTRDVGAAGEMSHRFISTLFVELPKSRSEEHANITLTVSGTPSFQTGATDEKLWLFDVAWSRINILNTKNHTI